MQTLRFWRMIDIPKIIPNGVFCHWSSWSVYTLTTQISNAYYVAFERTRKVTLHYPKFHLTNQSKELLGIGVTQKKV